MSKKIKLLQKAWALLDKQERRNAFKVIAVMIAGAFASATMVGSVFPFLSVLSNPSLINENSALRWVYEIGGFDSDYHFLVALGFGTIVIIIISNLVLILQTWVVARYTQMRVHSISKKLLAHYLSQPYEFFLGRHSGEMSTNILAEAQQVMAQFLRPFANLISSTLTVLAVVLTLLIVDPIVASATIGLFVAIYAVITMVTRRHVVRMGQRRVKANQQRFRIASETLGGIKGVKLLGREAAYVDKFCEPSVEMAKAQMGVIVLGNAPRFAIQMMAFGGIIVLVLMMLDPAAGIQNQEVLGGTLPLLGLLAFAGQRLMPELQILYNAITLMTSGAAPLERVYADLSIGSDKYIDRSRHVALGLQSQLELGGVEYTYPESELPSLSEINITIRAGERIGVVGSSGAGKTTIADLMLGLLTPQSGSIYVDGVEITQKNLRAWQRTVGYVPQDIFLTDGSLSENIALGLSPDEIDLVKVERASRIARIHDFAITELPNGYETLIGERGVRLSGGQRQRIGIARALYYDADLLIFDEATSAMDNVTEREIIASIQELPDEKTIVTIAHRLSTVKVCDRIVVMDLGKIADIGTWDELLKRNNDFREFAEA